jgi:uncharacterized membrane protein
MEGLLLIGFATGLRTMTPITVFCWVAYLGLLPQTGWGSWTGKLVSVIIFTVLALGEYYGDTRPETPNRTDIGPLLARLAFGAFTAALACHATQEPVAGGLIFGAIGALIGAFLGRRVRGWAAGRLGRDLPIALTESAIALGIALYCAWSYHGFYVVQQAAS